MEGNSKDYRKRNLYEKCIDTLSLGAVLHYASYRFLQSTMFSFYYSEMYKTVTMLLLVFFGGIRWLYIIIQKWDSSSDRKKLLLNILASFCLALPFVYTGLKQNYKFLVFLPVCCMCLYNMSAKKVLKYFSVTIGFLLTATVLCCLSGTVRNLITPWGHYTGAFGFINTSDFAAYFTFLLVTIWCTIGINKTYKVIIYILLNVFISIIVSWYTNTDTIKYIAGVFSAAILWDLYCERVKRRSNKLNAVIKSIDLITAFAFIFVGMLTIVLVTEYSKHNPIVQQLNEILSGRLEVTLRPFQKYGVHPFGTKIELMHGNGATIITTEWTEGYGYIDIAYAMLAIRYGWVITAIVCGLWIWMSKRALYNGYRKIALALAVFAVHAFSEARILDVNYNIFLVMPFCALEADKQEKYVECKEGKRSFALFLILCFGVLSISYLTLPKVLSLLRTIFFLEGWSDGTAALNSLAVCLILILIVYIIGKTIYSFHERIINRRIFIQVVIISILLVTCILGMNRRIMKGMEEQAERLQVEEPIIRLVEEVATQPIYADGAEELYRRKIGGIQERIFSMEELGREPKGSMFVEPTTESFAIAIRGGKYTQISKWSGLYSYDEAVIEALENAGYDWKPFYSGKRSCNMADALLFNGRKADGLPVIRENERFMTNNAEVDQLAGVYTVCFRLSLPEPSKYSNVVLEVLGESGERLIAQERLSVNDFDASGKCERKITYQIKDVPKVSFAVSAMKSTTAIIEEITWWREN